MFARSTTILAHRDMIDRGVAHVRDEVLPLLLETHGCIGLSMLVDRDSGRCIVTSAWTTRDAMLASERRVRAVRDRAVDMMAGQAQVDEWEIGVLHRAHTSLPGACVRVTWVRTSPNEMDRAVDEYRVATLPGMEEYPGFCSASLLLDRNAGLAVSSVTFDSRDAMDRTREQAATVRAQALAAMGADIVEVAEFELALAHLRVPEMA